MQHFLGAGDEYRWFRFAKGNDALLSKIRPFFTPGAFVFRNKEKLKIATNCEWSKFRF